jgi:hypothetical protein
MTGVCHLPTTAQISRHQNVYEQRKRQFENGIESASNFALTALLRAARKTKPERMKTPEEPFEKHGYFTYTGNCARTFTRNRA